MGCTVCDLLDFHSLTCSSVGACFPLSETCMCDSSVLFGRYFGCSCGLISKKSNPFFVSFFQFYISDLWFGVPDAFGVQNNLYEFVLEGGKTKTLLWSDSERRYSPSGSKFSVFISRLI